MRRHRLAERFLTDILGLSWADAHHEAGKWEHVMCEPVERAMDRVLGSPTTCPHGNPIPGSDYEAPDAVRLVDLGVGRTFTVSRIPEELEFTPGLLDFLEASAIQPGRSGEVTAASPDGTMTVEIEGHHVGVGAFASRPHPRHRRVRLVRTGPWLGALALALLLAGCGTTVVESPPTAAPRNVTTTTEAVPTTTTGQLDEIVDSALSLGDQIVDGDADVPLAHIDAVWKAATPAVQKLDSDIALGRSPTRSTP